MKTSGEVEHFPKDQGATDVTWHSVAVACVSNGKLRTQALTNPEQNKRGFPKLRVPFWVVPMAPRSYTKAMDSSALGSIGGDATGKLTP